MGGRVLGLARPCFWFVCGYVALILRSFSPVCGYGSHRRFVELWRSVAMVVEIRCQFKRGF